MLHTLRSKLTASAGALAIFVAGCDNSKAPSTPAKTDQDKIQTNVNLGPYNSIAECLMRKGSDDGTIQQGGALSELRKYAPKRKAGEPESTINVQYPSDTVVKFNCTVQNEKGSRNVAFECHVQPDGSGYCPPFPEMMEEHLGVKDPS